MEWWRTKRSRLRLRPDKVKAEVKECYSEPFAFCHSERSEESQEAAQGKLREESQRSFAIAQDGT